MKRILFVVPLLLWNLSFAGSISPYSSSEDSLIQSFAKYDEASRELLEECLKLSLVYNSHAIEAWEASDKFFVAATTGTVGLVLDVGEKLVAIPVCSGRSLFKGAAEFFGNIDTYDVYDSDDDTLGAVAEAYKGTSSKDYFVGCYAEVVLDNYYGLSAWDETNNTYVSTGAVVLGTTFDFVEKSLSAVVFCPGGTLIKSAKGLYKSVKSFFKK
jgi:hypothetical protein